MLIGHSSLILFLTGAVIILVIPGPAVMYVVSRSIGHGRAAGLVSVMGIVVGTLFHVVLATLGLSALLASSALAFQVVQYVAAAYLVYLGIRTSKLQWTAQEKLELLASLEALIRCMKSLHATMGAVMADVSAIRNTLFEDPEDLAVYRSNLRLAAATANSRAEEALSSYDDLLAEVAASQRFAN